jgi:hypothetical protein
MHSSLLAYFPGVKTSKPCNSGLEDAQRWHTTSGLKFLGVNVGEVHEGKLIKYAPDSMLFGQVTAFSYNIHGSHGAVVSSSKYFVE